MAAVRIDARSLGLLAIVIALTALGQSPAHADRAEARKWVEDGETHRARGDRSEALRHYEKAITADPDYLPAYELAAPMWLELRRYDTVIEHLERVTLRHPDYTVGWYTLAYAYRLSGRAGNAIAAYELYIGMRPDEAAPHFGLAMAHKQAQQPERALAAFRRYVELERDPARNRFVVQARREIAALSGDPVAATPLAPVGGRSPGPRPALTQKSGHGHSAAGARAASSPGPGQNGESGDTDADGEDRGEPVVAIAPSAPQRA
ncbi:MAG: tetratricopeptide repeat protein, partial [Myxococcota bacterium]